MITGHVPWFHVLVNVIPNDPECLQPGLKCDGILDQGSISLVDEDGTVWQRENGGSGPHWRQRVEHTEEWRGSGHHYQSVVSSEEYTTRVTALIRQCGEHVLEYRESGAPVH